MKRKSFYHLSLAVPYLALMLSGGITYFGNPTNPFDPPPNVLLGLMAFFTGAAVVWAPFYTWMVVVLLFWARDKTAAQVKRTYLLTPLILACSLGLPVMAIDLISTRMLVIGGLTRLLNLDFLLPTLLRNVDVEQSLSAGFVWIVVATICLVIGYIFVGIILLIERELQKRQTFRDEPDADSSYISL